MDFLHSSLNPRLRLHVHLWQEKVLMTLQGDKERYIVWDRVQVTTLARGGFPDDGGLEKRK